MIEQLETRSLMAAVRALPGFSTTAFPANDDESVGPVSLGFSSPINYFGTSTSTTFINNNGNLTFDSALRTYTPFNLSTTNRKILAPFFADVETFGNNIVRYGNDRVDGRNAFGVRWPGVGYYSSESKRNFFELVIIERFDTGAGNFDVEFNYDQINWETGSSSGGSNGLGGNSARVGFASGNNGPFREFVGSAINGAFLDSNTTTGLIHNRYRSTTPGRYVLTVRGGAVVDPDLQVANVQATNLPAVSGSTVNIQWVVRNTGNDPTPNSWSDRVRVVNRATGAVISDQLIIYDLLANGNGAIAPGASRTRTASVQLPHGQAGVGSFDITVSTDALQQIFEANSNNTSESNNSATGSFTSTLAPYPNLGAQTQGVPAGIDALQSFQVTFDVNNSGTGPANGSWKDRIYLSTSQTINVNSVLLTELTSLSNLAVNSSYRHVVDVIAPQVAEGNYFIITVANHDEAIFELDRSNNLLASPIRISRPDLKPRIEVFLGSTPLLNGSGSIDFGATARNQPVTRSVTIRNTGPTEMTLGTVVAAVNSGFAVVSQPSTTVPPNGQTTFQIRLNSTQAGTSSGTISIPNNDPTKNPFTFQVSGFVYENVDLVVTDIRTATTSTIGGEVDLTWTVQNQGDGEYRGTFSDRVSISSDAIIGNDRSVASFVFTGNLLPGQLTTRTQRITIPNDLAGNQYFVVRTDLLNEVVENSENNNVLIDDLALNILAADLQVYDIEVAPVVPTGTQTEVRWKVKNAGNAATLVGAAWTDRVYLSSDILLDAGDLQLASIINPQALAIDESYASSANVTIPYGTYGVRYLIIQTDAGTQVVELTESNNVTSSRASNITWQPPDLRVENVVSQAFAFSGAPTRVSWDVRNVGRTAMLPSEGTWRDRVYLSTDATLDRLQDRALGEFTHTGVLLPGEGYTQAVDVTMPVASLLTADEYFLIVETDWRNEVKEGLFEGNNWTSETSTTRVLRVPPPDLVVDSIGSIPASIFAGQPIDVTFRVRNSGAGDTEPTNTRWTDAVYLSTNDSLDSSDRLLGRVNRNGGLKKDDPPYEQSARFQIPSDLVGEHKLIVVTNVFGQVFGDDVSNNQRVATSSINIQRPPADLDVISVSPAVSTVVVGSPLTVDFMVRNIGPQATTVSTWTDRIYLSRDTILDPANDELFGEFVRTGTLAASAEYQSSATKTVSQAGAFYVLVQSDAGDAVFEIVDSNNVQASSQQVNVVPIPADLTTSHIVVPSVARSGFETSISYRVSNTGPNPTLGSNWLDRVYLSTDGVLDSSDRLLKSVSRFGTLAAAPEFYEVTTAVSLPDGLATGQYHVIVHADALDAVFEQDNLDNIAASVNRVTLVSEPADLVVTSISAPAESTVGQSLRVDWTVKNEGTGDTVVSSWRERVYLSDDNVFNAASDALLREFVYTHINSSVEAPLGADKSISRSEVVSFADNVLGDKFLFVVVDSTNLVFEPGAENNNVSVAQPIKRVQRDTDLQVFDVIAPATATEGVAFDVSWTVRNVGTAPTNAAFWYDEVYVSTDNVLSANDVRLGSVRRSNPLSGTGQSGNQYSVTGPFAIPIGVTAGIAAPFFVLVKTDGGATSLVPERLEDNNVTAAASATIVSPGTVALLPDLRVLSVVAPVAAQVGQPITVNWTVQNTGPGDVTNGSWFDSVYLSLDQVLDRQNGQNQARDIFLGTKAQVRSLLKDATYSDSGTFTVPAGLSGDYFVLVATDFRNNVAEGVTAEGNNVGIGSSPLTVEPKAPADLVVGTITIPATGISGQAATISYTVTNNGQNPAIGSWYDAIYISADATWDVNDPLFGRVLHRGDVPSLGSYSESLTATLPGVLPGNYHVIIRSDIRNQIAESDEQNNLRATLDQFALDVTALTSGVPIDTNIGLGESAYFKIIVPANRTLGLSIDSASDTADTQLYVSKGTLPTQSRFDFSSNQAGKADHFLLVPDTEEATYYVLVKRVASPGTMPRVTVQADLIGYSLLSTDVSRIGNSGSVTIAITGAQLRGTQSVSLVGATPSEKRDATRFLVVDSSLLYATFDLTELAAGSYSLTAVNDAAEIATLASAINVEAARGGPAKLALSAPDNVRPGQTFQATLTVYNDGNVDTAAPLVQFDSDSTMLLGYDASDLQDELLTVVVVPPGGFRDTLRPGQSVEIVVIAREKVGNGNTATLNVSTVGDAGQSIDLLPFRTDAEFASQFESAGEVATDLLRELSFGSANQIAKSLVQFASDSIDVTSQFFDAKSILREKFAVSYYLSTEDEASQNFSVAGRNPTYKPASFYPVTTPNTGDASKGKIRYVVAGFLSGDPPPEWAQTLAVQLKLKCPDDTVFVVGWESGFEYVAATRRTEYLGEEIAGHILAQLTSLNKPASDVVIYGHSLGAQAAGFAGTEVRRQTGALIGQIVGFDPAGPLFGGSNPDGHLEQSDASRVQVINTSKTLGRFSCDGHENYYPDTRNLDVTIPNAVSNHSYSHQYYLSRLVEDTGADKDPDLGRADQCVPGERKIGKIEHADRDIKRAIRVVASLDPNDIIGPSGFGPENWITATQPLNYTIRFENDPIFATAPAQRIEITQTLDSDLDARSFRLGDFGFGELFVDVPENRSVYSQRIDLRDTKGIFVDVFAGINVANSEAFWTFIAVDPVTGDLPEDPLKGILPPNLNPPEGDGFVRYSVKAKAGVTTGTRIDAQARIVFDINEPIDTPPIFNTLDAVTPTSQVTPLDPLLVANQARFPVQWSGSDDANGSAIRGFDIYVNVDAKGFQPWLTNVTYTDALYDGPVGTSYAFYSVARDHAGNSESAPVTPDASIRVVAARDVRIEIGERTIASLGEIVEFGEAIVGATAVQRTFTVRNSGTETLVLGSASFTEGAGFTIVTNLTEGLTLAPNATATLVVSLDAAAIGNKTRTLQFGTNVPGKTPFRLALRGEVVPVPTLRLALETGSIGENGGTTIATLSRNTSTSLPLSVSVSSDNPSRLSFPSRMTIPAGAMSASFVVRTIDNTIADGTQPIAIWASAPEIATGTTSVTVVDDEIARLTLTIAPSTISEKNGSATGTVTRNTPATSALTVTLGSSNLLAVTVPATVLIPAGQSSATFAIASVDDSVAGGNKSTTITVSSSGLVSATAPVTVIDDEVPSLGFTIAPASISENGGIATGTVTRNTPTTSALTVTLNVSDSTEVTFPTSVTIPIGATSATFQITAINDSIVDGDQDVQITASASGFQSVETQVKVTDADLAPLPFQLAVSSIAENGGIAIGLIQLSAPLPFDLNVALSSSDVSAATVSPTITIPAGVVVKSFDVLAVDDLIADGNQSTTITLIANGFLTSTAQLVVVDNESPTLQIVIANSSISEPSGTSTARVRRNTPTTNAIVVSLLSTNPAEAIVPATVTIPAGASEASFVITAVADNIVDGPKMVFIAASSGTMNPASIEITVIDIDVWSWTNPRNPLDTDDDSSISPLDVLSLINDLNNNGSRRLTTPTVRPQVYLDPDRDGFISPLDVLSIVNYLNQGSGEGEGESATAPLREGTVNALMFADVDQYFSSLNSGEFSVLRRRRASNSRT